MLPLCMLDGAGTGKGGELTRSGGTPRLTFRLWRLSAGFWLSDRPGAFGMLLATVLVAFLAFLWLPKGPGREYLGTISDFRLGVRRSDTFPIAVVELGRGRQAMVELPQWHGCVRGDRIEVWRTPHLLGAFYSADWKACRIGLHAAKAP